MGLYIGLMSGTSMDGVDAALVDIDTHQLHLVETISHPIPDNLKQSLRALCLSGDDEINRLTQADVAMGHVFAEATNTLLQKAKKNPTDIKAIGSHGQTIRHFPFSVPPVTLQIGDPNVIVEKTGITTVTDFRRRNLVLGGQGAPLAPAFHQWLWPDLSSVVVNIGGIANVTLLDNELIGFDTGPGNVLSDAWIQAKQKKAFDVSGAWAASGKVDESLLTLLLADNYFKKTFPKSTGREYFNLSWLEKNLQQLEKMPNDEDVQASLIELTACSIADAIKTCAPEKYSVMICGGGAYNNYLLKRLSHYLPTYKIITSHDHGYAPDWIEAMAFAWFAKQTLIGEALNVASVTGAKNNHLAGGVYYP